MNYRYIAVEGNIGAGKSTLARLLADHYGARLIEEQFEDNNFLPRFYADAERYAFPLELSFMADRYKQLKHTLLHPELFKDKVVSDYILTKTKLFARINLKEEEYELFQRIFDMIDIHIPPPDLLIYLHAPVQKLQQNIRRRGRPFELQIADEYLEKVQNVYQQYLKQEAVPTLIIDTGSADFKDNPAHFQQLTDFIEAGYEFRTAYLSPT